MMAKQVGDAKPVERSMLTAIVPVKAGLLVLKLSGAHASVDAATEPFERLVASIK